VDDVRQRAAIGLDPLLVVRDDVVLADGVTVSLTVLV
jgi:hypothetical protein